ncbi:MAG: O-acetylhomoserine aminocarboxypropyltransferase/cysteine synthase family protein [Rikenellaceae bacterium]
MKFHFNTLAVHAGQPVDEATLSSAAPLYQTNAYQFKSVQHAIDLFTLKASGNIYTRLQNPTTDIFEQRMAALENGVAAVAASSGHAAQVLAITTIMSQGDNFVSSPFLYGGSFNQFKHTFKQFGIECRFANSDRAEDMRGLIDDSTKAIYVETIGNPAFSIPDFESLAALANEFKIPLIVDNTFGCGGYLCRPLDFGAHILVESSTKWIGGHGTSMGGVIVDGGTFDWAASGRFPLLTEPSPAYHGISYTETFGNLAFIVRVRTEGLRDLGSCQSPFNSREMLIGLETLALRCEREAENALKLAQWLEQSDKVKKVLYPGLESDPNHSNAAKYLKNGFGCVLSVELEGDIETTSTTINSLKLVTHVANVGDCRTLIIQPATTTHSQLTAQEQLAAGVTPTLLRVSLGVEHIDDIIGDFQQAFDIAFAK